MWINLILLTIYTFNGRTINSLPSIQQKQLQTIRKKAELGYNSLLNTLMSHDVKHHIVGVTHRFLPYAC